MNNTAHASWPEKLILPCEELFSQLRHRLRSHETLQHTLFQSMDRVMLELIWELHDQQTIFPSEDLLDSLHAYERRERDDLARALTACQESLSEVLEFYSLTPVLANRHYLGCSVYSGNLILQTIPKVLKDAHALSI